MTATASEKAAASRSWMGSENRRASRRSEIGRRRWAAGGIVSRTVVQNVVGVGVAAESAEATRKGVGEAAKRSPASARPLRLRSCTAATA